jgi:hypothetical protein
LAILLPYLDQEALFQQIDFNDTSPVVQGSPIWTSSEQNQRIIDHGVPVFRCPSDRDHSGTNYRANLGPSPFVYWAPSDLGGCSDPGPKPGNGAFVHDRSLFDGEFKDGLSNTVFFSERSVGDNDPARYDPWRDVFCARPVIGFCSADQAIQYCSSRVRADSPHDSWCGLTWLFGGWEHTWYHHLLAPNSPIPDCSDGCLGVAGGGEGLYTARSQHTGGVNIVLGDGASRFIAEQIELGVWRALSTRAGADVVTE